MIDHRPFVVIVPVYEDRKSAVILMTKLKALCTQEPFIIAVEDGSLHDPLMPSDIGNAGLVGEIVYLRRNMGHQRAIAAGLVYASTYHQPESAVVMDCDGEDRPEVVNDLLEGLRGDDTDVVVAIRGKRSESLAFRLFYAFYRLIFLILTGRTIQFGNFSALSGLAVKRLSATQEIWIHLAASLTISRLHIAALRVDRGARYAGNSKMNFLSLVLHGMHSLTVFAEIVLVRIVVACSCLIVVVAALLLVPAILKLIGSATPGWFTAATGILIVILLQAGILTFTMLLFASSTRSMPLVSPSQLDQLIDRVEQAVPLCQKSMQPAEEQRERYL